MLSPYDGHLIQGNVKKNQFDWLGFQNRGRLKIKSTTTTYTYKIMFNNSNKNYVHRGFIVEKMGPITL